MFLYWFTGSNNSSRRLPSGSTTTTQILRRPVFRDWKNDSARQFNGAVGSNDRVGSLSVCGERAGDRRDAFRKTPGRQSHLYRRPKRIDVHPADHAFGFGAEDHAADIHCIAAHVEERAATEAVDIADIGCIEGPQDVDGKMGADFANLSDRTGCNELLHTASLRVEPVHEAFHEADTMLFAGLDLRAASFTDVANGLSQSAAFPSAAARIVHSACRALGRAMYTAST